MVEHLPGMLEALGSISSKHSNKPKEPSLFPPPLWLPLWELILPFSYFAALKTKTLGV